MRLPFLDRVRELARLRRALSRPDGSLIVVYGRRRCGKSRLVQEALREHLEVEAWTILGLSWGTTLSLAYAQTHPQRVNALVLGLVTTTVTGHDILDGICLALAEGGR